MSESSLPNAVVGQSGGPTAVINQSLVGVVETLRDSGRIGRILGARHAVRGMIEDDFVELQSIDKAKLDRIAATPSSALGSSRDKPDRAYCEKIFEVLKRRNVGYFYYIGGNDSSDTCRIISELSAKAGFDLRCYHVPKTIDNDLQKNDHTPGFGSAARFVAQAFMGDNLDNKALPGIKINVVMGRHAGFLTAASLLARQRQGDGPHLIYVPETSFDIDQFLGQVDGAMKKYGRCLIAVSEGIHDKDGTPMAVKLAEQSKGEIERDSHGNVQLSGTGALGDFLSELIKTRLNAKRVRADTFGYLQRSFVGCVSPSDAVEAREVGRMAARLSLEGGEGSGSVAIQRVSSRPYQVEYKRIELSDVAAKTKVMDASHLVNGCDVAESFREYLEGIVGELPVVEQF
ncbi:MAG: 6-phosphofructokinase [Phycisphaeraceae bacterium]|nr:6-phosphofructokinase [Phycisphaeraceae bacterium]